MPTSTHPGQTDAEMAHAARLMIAAKLAKLIPDAEVTDYPHHHETSVVWNTAGIGFGAISIDATGQLRVALQDIPAHAVRALAEALAAGQGGRTPDSEESAS